METLIRQKLINGIKESIFRAPDDIQWVESNSGPDHIYKTYWTVVRSDQYNYDEWSGPTYRDALMTGAYKRIMISDLMPGYIPKFKTISAKELIRRLNLESMVFIYTDHTHIFRLLRLSSVNLPAPSIGTTITIFNDPMVDVQIGKVDLANLHEYIHGRWNVLEVERGNRVWDEMYDWAMQTMNFKKVNLPYDLAMFPEEYFSDAQKYIANIETVDKAIKEFKQNFGVVPNDKMFEYMYSQMKP